MEKDSTTQRAPDIIKEGYIMKEGGSYQSWKDRFLVIETEKLSYYANESLKKKHGEILHKDIIEVKAENPDYKGKRFVFSIATTKKTKKIINRKFYIQAGDDTSRDAWIHSVQQLIFEALVDSVNEARGSQKTAGDKKVSTDDFIKLKCIGRGGFGRVLLVKKKGFWTDIRHENFKKTIYHHVKSSRPHHRRTQRPSESRAALPA